METGMECEDGPAAKRVPKKNLLERLAEGPVIGDGGMIWTLEQRGYASTDFTPEAVVEQKDAVLQIHRDFIHNGAEIVQACNFWSKRVNEEHYGGQSINAAACSLALQAAAHAPHSVLVGGSVTKTTSYEQGLGKDVVQAEFRRQLEFYVENNFDFVVAEYIDTVEEAIWAVEVLQQSSKPVMATLCIGPEGDIDGVSPQECAVRLAQAGANVVGVNCRFGPTKCLETIAMMRRGLEESQLGQVFLAVQPFGYHTPDASLTGYKAMAEFPYAVDARCLTRADAHKYAVEAFKLGVRYIGGCCGFEPRHIRAMSEALQEQRGVVAPATQKYGKWRDHTPYRPEDSLYTPRHDSSYWLTMQPATGRPRSSALSQPMYNEEAKYLRSMGRSAP